MESWSTPILHPWRRLVGAFAAGMQMKKVCCKFGRRMLKKEFVEIRTFLDPLSGASRSRAQGPVKVGLRASMKIPLNLPAIAVCAGL
jgi:hypothetical protein